jgi:hypothetical protein
MSLSVAATLCFVFYFRFKSEMTADERNGLGVITEMRGKCMLCSTVTRGFNCKFSDSFFVLDKYDSIFEAACPLDDHRKNLETWLRKAPSSADERIFFSKALDDHIDKLESTQDRNEIKLMLLDFVQETYDDENSFSEILERLGELKQNQQRMFVCLAAWKQLAEGVANEEAITLPSLTTMREVHEYVAVNRYRWKQFLNSVLASGSVHLVAQLVGPFLGWGSDGIKNSEEEGAEGNTDESAYGDGDY